MAESSIWPAFRSQNGHAKAHRVLWELTHQGRRGPPRLALELAVRIVYIAPRGVVVWRGLALLRSAGVPAATIRRTEPAAREW